MTLSRAAHPSSATSCCTNSTCDANIEQADHRLECTQPKVPIDATTTSGSISVFGRCVPPEQLSAALLDSPVSLQTHHETTAFMRSSHLGVFASDLTIPSTRQLPECVLLCINTHGPVPLIIFHPRFPRSWHSAAWGCSENLHYQFNPFVPLAYARIEAVLRS
ncbi:hypothetical protein LshimejAT787_0502190 [Lyophyllum shimeji]|uniref:Uncharacterized protein n=1 Tax=Lyophyllum shimeji TaxID=47721 RepID=A0A9P3PMW1_LYOSH|nr:hypothetical protein LshimejAT787_0502190 [Lyophyllum shimeji]